VLQGLEFCYAYIDDILIASISEEEHLKHLRILFKRLRKYDFIINLAKCVFEQPEVKFLGYLVSGTEIHPLPEKIDAYPRPDTVKKLRQFLGMLNFYRRIFTQSCKNTSTVERPPSRQYKRKVASKLDINDYRSI